MQNRALIIVGVGWVLLFALIASFQSCGQPPNPSFPRFPESSEGYEADEPDPENTDAPDCKCYCYPEDTFGNPLEDWRDSGASDLHV